MPKTTTEQTPAGEHPVRIFQLSYAKEFYVCSCGASVRSECICCQETLLQTAYNHHYRDPKVVAWLSRQNGPFTVSEAVDALRLGSDDKSYQLIMRMRLHRELSDCGCTYDVHTKSFIAPEAETLLRLRLHPSASSQSRCEEYQPCLPAPVLHPEPSPVLHADHQSTPVDQTEKNGQLTLQQST